MQNLGLDSHIVENVFLEITLPLLLDDFRQKYLDKRSE